MTAIALEIFQDKHVFFGLADDQLRKIAEVAEQRIYNESELICREGEMGDAMFIIESGSVDVVKRKVDGGEILLAGLSSGSVFGEMSLVSVEPRSATVRARETTVAIILRNNALSEIFDNDRELFIVLLLNLTRILSKRLRQTNDRLLSSGRP